MTLTEWQRNMEPTLPNVTSTKWIVWNFKALDFLAQRWSLGWLYNMRPVRRKLMSFRFQPSVSMATCHKTFWRLVTSPNISGQKKKMQRQSSMTKTCHSLDVRWPPLNFYGKGWRFLFQILEFTADFQIYYCTFIQKTTCKAIVYFPLTRPKNFI